MNVANGYWLPFLKARRIPTIVNVDGVEWMRDKWGPLARKVFLGGARATALLADELICDSQAICRLWRDEFQRSGIFIPYGGDLVDIAPTYDDLGSREYVLFVARLVPENSVQQFFAACSRLSEDFDVVIVGSSGYGGEFDQMANELCLKHRRVRWYGHLRDDGALNSLWHHAGVYFHGHTVGGTNPSLVQAMACGSPIVAVDTVFNREVLGNAGALVQPNSDSIANEIVSLMRDEKRKEEMGDAARKRAGAVYSWESVCHEYETLLKALVDKSSS
jgi:glycosyltransferase involved in cell wall biosynthesis